MLRDLCMQMISGRWLQVGTPWIHGAADRFGEVLCEGEFPEAECHKT